MSFAVSSAGQTISHYTLTRKLGAGTYGEVYEAVHQHDPELRVAIKIVSPALVQDTQFVEALKRECRQLDRLDHPNIVRFRDLVVSDGRVAMVLELLSGQDLHARLAGGPLPVDTAVSVVEALLEGLAYAHGRGILHRDIKPGNVFWCDDGRIKLLDFGVARAADGTQATKTGHLVGTFDYMAPERFDGQHGTASSDVYAVGLIAWELLTGRPACPDGEPGRKMKWHLMHGIGGAGAVLAAVPGCPPWLAEVVAMLSAVEVAERPEDGGAALALLREKRAASGSVAGAAPRRSPPATVAGPLPVGSAPPVAMSVPPVSVPPASKSVSPLGGPAARSAPPRTVMAPGPVGGTPAATTHVFSEPLGRTVPAATLPPQTGFPTDAFAATTTAPSVADLLDPYPPPSPRRWSYAPWVVVALSIVGLTAWAWSSDEPDVNAHAVDSSRSSQMDVREDHTASRSNVRIANAGVEISQRVAVFTMMLANDGSVDASSIQVRLTLKDKNEHVLGEREIEIEGGIRAESSVMIGALTSADGAVRRVMTTARYEQEIQADPTAAARWQDGLDVQFEGLRDVAAVCGSFDARLTWSDVEDLGRVGAPENSARAEPGMTTHEEVVRLSCG